MNSSDASSAILSNSGDFTSFTFGAHTIRFRTPSSLYRYTSVKEWDNGYLVVTAKYRDLPDEEEEYIDLMPILNNLYFDAESFLAPIKKVSIRYDN